MKEEKKQVSPWDLMMLARFKRDMMLFGGKIEEDFKKKGSPVEKQEKK